MDGKSCTGRATIYGSWAVTLPHPLLGPFATFWKAARPSAPTRPSTINCKSDEKKINFLKWKNCCTLQKFESFFFHPNCYRKKRKKIVVFNMKKSSNSFMFLSLLMNNIQFSESNNNNFSIFLVYNNETLANIFFYKSPPK